MNLAAALVALAALLAAQPEVSLSAGPVDSPPKHLAATEFDLEVRGGLSRHRSRVRAALAFLNKSPSAKAWHKRWKNAAGAQEPLVVQIAYLGHWTRGMTRDHGPIYLSLIHVEWPLPFLAGVIAHEWFGHRLTREEMLNVSPEAAELVETETIARARGYRVFGEIDGAEAFTHPLVVDFLEQGPAEWFAEAQEGSYSLWPTLDDLRDPETFYRGQVERLEKQVAAISGDLAAQAKAGWGSAEWHVRDELLASLDSATYELGELRGRAKDAEAHARWRELAMDPTARGAVAALNEEAAAICDWGRRQAALPGPCRRRPPGAPERIGPVTRAPAMRPPRTTLADIEFHEPDGPAPASFADLPVTGACGSCETLRASLRLLDKSPSARKWLEDWTRLGGSTSTLRLGYDDGPPDQLVLDPSLFGEPLLSGAVAVAHDWFGHRLPRLRLYKLVGDADGLMETERLASARGARVLLEIDPESARYDRGLRRFVEAGPKLRLESPGPRVDCWNTVGLAELKDPEKALRRLSAQLAKADLSPKPDPLEEQRRAAIVAPEPNLLEDDLPSDGPPAAPLGDVRSSLEEARRQVAARLADKADHARWREAFREPGVRTLAAELDTEAFETCDQARLRLEAGEGPCPR